MVYRRIIAMILCACLLAASGFKVSGAEPPKETELYARAAVLMDGASGRVLYEKNGYEAMANASTTKILTCILALENCETESQANVSAYAASQPKVRLGIREGQTFYLKDMLYGLMLESFNDCAVVIAEHVAGDVVGFAELMNRKAEEIGCKDTHFVTPNGLDGTDDGGFHHTTAEDLAKIMRYCIKSSPKAAEFLEITRAPSYSFTDVDGTSSYQCSNHNAFLQMMDGALSGKTGFTGTAGYCYVGALERDGRTYIVALLACGWPNNKTYKWSDTKKLMTYGLETYTKKNTSEIALEKMEPIPVSGGQGEKIGEALWVMPGIGDYEGEEEFLLKEGEEITVSYRIAPQLEAPVEAGADLGKVIYELDGTVIGERPVTAKNEIPEIDYVWCLARTVELLWLSEKEVP